MKPYAELTKEELLALRNQLRAEYKRMQAKNLTLNMSRGNPCTEQLDLSMGMMDVMSSSSDMTCEDGTDCRNYGVLCGIPEAQELMGDMMEVPYDHLILYGNSSLNVMYDTISRSYSHGVMGNTPWCKLDKVKFLCVVPGYDRHFAITEYFGIENIPVPMLEDGPDMDLVEKLVAEDEAIKGIWCVPKYSNPSGNSYSDETVRRMARLKPAAKDFRLYWDNAYSIHHLYDHDQDNILEILAECKRAGNPDLAYKFASQLKIQTIGHDKVNQLRHVRFFKDIHGMVEHMRKHANILRPKFELVENTLEEELGGLEIGTWTKPKGGYFICFWSIPGCAKKIVSYCAKAGVIMTPAGATYPGGKEPQDSTIRIAPSFPPIEDLGIAVKLFALCVKLVSVEHILEEMEKTEKA